MPVNPPKQPDQPLDMNQAAIFTDLDGSLRCARNGVHATDRELLLELGRQGIARIVATGRSLWVARKALEPDFPIDYLIFSSGAGVLDWRSQTLIYRADLSATQAREALAALQMLELDGMLHHPVPENHAFCYFRQRGLPDFEARLARYSEFATPLPKGWHQPCSQLLAITEASRTAAIHTELQARLPQLTVLRSTSPLDGSSGWLEIFPRQVSKSQTSAWLKHRQRWQRTMAFGNDYNDADLLAWADQAYVTCDAPAELRARFIQVAVPAEAGFSQAVRQWLKHSPQADDS